MAIEIFDTIEQNSPEWLQVRCGVITASEFDSVMAQGKGGAESKTRLTYMRKLAGEIITGRPAENYSNQAMDRGHIMEGEARDHYAFVHGVTPVQVGFVRNGRIGCSPDSLIGEDGGLEIKTKAPHLLIEVLDRGDIPPEHVKQVQGSMLVTGRPWWDFMAYYSGMPPFVKRIHRDELYIAKMRRAIEEFTDELDALVERIRAMGAAA